MIIYMIIASVIAACGLLSSSMPVIIASMIISPILQPITNSIFDLKTNNKYSSILTTFSLIVLVIFIGFIIGLINHKLGLFHPENEHMANIVLFDNKQEKSKLITELCIALAVGIGLPYAIINKDTTLMVAFGIAPSITPPLVNCGLYLSNYLVGLNNTMNKDINNYETLQKSKRSAFLGLMHIVVILFMCLLYSKLA